MTKGRFTDRIIDGKKRKVIVDDGGNIINRSPSKEELKGLDRFPEKDGRRSPRRKPYKVGSICPRCKEDGVTENNATEKNRLYPVNARREKDKDGKETGRTICLVHWRRYYNKYDPSSIVNIRKSIANCRTGNQDPNHENTKGYMIEDVVCELRGWINLNKKYDNYRTGIDCFDEKTGFLYQVQGRRYSPEYRWWSFGHFNRELTKKYKNMICVCLNENGNVIEEIYEFPSDIIGYKGLTIVRYDSIGRPYKNGWYEKYRIKGTKRKEELNRSNDILKRMLEEEKKEI